LVLYNTAGPGAAKGALNLIVATLPTVIVTSGGRFAAVDGVPLDGVGAGVHRHREQIGRLPVIDVLQLHDPDPGTLSRIPGRRSAARPGKEPCGPAGCPITRSS